MKRFHLIADLETHASPGPAECERRNPNNPDLAYERSKPRNPKPLSPKPKPLPKLENPKPHDICGDREFPISGQISTVRQTEMVAPPNIDSLVRSREWGNGSL